MRRRFFEISSRSLIYLSLALFYFGATTFKASAQQLYVMDQLNKTLWAMNLDGSARSAVLTFPLYNPYDITLDAAARKMYWTESDTVMSANLDGTDQQAVWQPGPSGFKGIAEDASTGKLYVMDQLNKTLWAMNLDGSARSAVLTFPLYNPWDIALDAAAGKMYWTVSDTVMSANLDGTDQQAVWQPGPSGFKGVAIIPEPTTLHLMALAASILIALILCQRKSA